MKVPHECLGQVLLPDFLLVGAAKSATSSLHYYLGQHPQVRMCAIKESWFFSFATKPPNYKSPAKLENVVSRLDEYVKLFQGARADHCLGDASPSYLYTYRDSIRNIQSVYPPEYLEKLRIIISLREPVGRAFSQYQMFKRDMAEPLTFEEATEASTVKKRLDNNWNIFYDYAGFGDYYDQVKAYLDAFGKDRVLVVLYDDIRKDAVGVCQTIYSFLDIDSRFEPDTSMKINTITGEPRSKWLVRFIRSRNPVKRALAARLKSVLARLPRKKTQRIVISLFESLFRRTEMDESTRCKMIRAQSDDIRRLEVLINRDLSTWIKNT